MMTQDNTLCGIGFALTYNVHTTCSSDHASFWSHGYTAVMTHSETHGYAHTSSDTIDKVSTAYALKNGQLGMAVLAQTAEVRGSVKNPTTLTIASSTATSAVNVAFKLSAVKIRHDPPHQEARPPRARTGATGTWANVARTFLKTDGSGKVTVSQTVSTAGTYQYRWHFNGTTTYRQAYSKGRQRQETATAILTRVHVRAEDNTSVDNGRGGFSAPLPGP